jgi:hypothetical protein
MRMEPLSFPVVQKLGLVSPDQKQMSEYGVYQA